MRFILSFCFALIAAQAYADSRVVVSIKPLHALAAAIMEGEEEPLLLVDGKDSPHSFQLKPSQMRALTQADVVFYTGHGMEGFLDKVLTALPARVKRISMDSLPNISLLHVRGAHVHDDDHDHHDEGPNDMHLWLSPANAQAMVAGMTKALCDTYTQNCARYEANAKKLASRVEHMDANLKPRMAKLAGKKFIVFHDAYQYFEKAYGLSMSQAILLQPEGNPGAKHMAQMRKVIQEQGAVCVFGEPQSGGALVETLTAGTLVKTGVLDAEGGLLTKGRELYFHLMENIASSLEKCAA